MNAFTANDLEAADLEAADLLALARLDDDGAPCRSRPSDEHAAAGPAGLHPAVPATAPGRSQPRPPAADARPLMGSG
jgi:hypothetical protein